MSAITPCLWFDDQGEEAARYYVSLFPSSSIGTILHWGPENPARQGQALTVEFVLDGMPFTALNGGPQFTFSEAVSLQIDCADQAEVDHYWDAFVGDGGGKSDCGWCRDSASPGRSCRASCRSSCSTPIPPAPGARCSHDDDETPGRGRARGRGRRLTRQPSCSELAPSC